LTAFEVVPAAQGVQMRLFAEEGTLLTKVPAGQSVHGVHEVMFSVVVKELGGQGGHDRLAVAEPGWAM
jgi:hypothetical protein